ncbi:hypothetical protein PXD04_00560 [Methanosphaera sp. ISO3-F5]|nr:hypothetical protein [Methanosphaera sp. ISO3-F5]WQH64320.1 hypothetical protein PXD04_00560 [Methanosphaera sp. ISO3-F5]
MIETRIYDDKTLIPRKYLKKYDLKDEDYVIWTENDDGEIIIKFRKK